VLLGGVLFLCPVAHQWLCGFGKRSEQRSPSDLGFIGQNSWVEIFIGSHSLPPSLVCLSSLQVVSKPVAGLCDSNQTKIHRATKREGVLCLVVLVFAI
jgi:hypothetical protein